MVVLTDEASHQPKTVLRGKQQWLDWNTGRRIMFYATVVKRDCRMLVNQPSLWTQEEHFQLPLKLTCRKSCRQPNKGAVTSVLSTVRCITLWWHLLEAVSCILQIKQMCMMTVWFYVCVFVSAGLGGLAEALSLAGGSSWGEIWCLGSPTSG